MPSFDEDVSIEQHDLVLRDVAGIDVVRIDNEAAVTIGFTPKDQAADAPTRGPGTIRVVGVDGSDAIVLDGFDRDEDPRAQDAGSITLRGGGGGRAVRIDGSTASIALGGDGRTGGGVVIRDADDRVLARIARGFVDLGAEGDAARIYVRNEEGGVAIELDGHNGRLLVNGTAERAGRIDVRNGELRDALSLDAGASSLTVGCEDAPGRLLVRDREQRVALTLEADGPSLNVGRDGASGDLVVVNSVGGQAFHVIGGTGKVQVGSPEDASGTLGVYDDDGRETVQLRGHDATQYLGAVDGGAPGRLVIRDDDGDNAIDLDGTAADIKLMGADVAEDFDAAAPLEPGAVVVATGPDAVAPAGAALDRRVVGVVSGAGDFQPGLRLGSKPGGERVPVAIVGRAACLADAGHGPIEPGDLLTTSPTEGHAMRVADVAAAAGAILGKALGSLRTDTGLVPLLLTLR